MTGRRKIPVLRDAGGAAAIEFAIVGSVFLLFLIGISYVAIMLWDASTLNWAVTSATRTASLNSSASQSDITTAVNGYLSSVGMGAATVAYTVTTSNGLRMGQISATQNKTFVIPLLNTYNVTFHASASVPLP